MDYLEERKNEYFNYLANEVIKAIQNSDRYSCIDFELLKIDLMLVLNHIMDNRQDFNRRVKILSLNDKKRWLFCFY